LALYKAFGWKPPTFAHLGLLTNDDGSKLSKRNDSANVSKYRQQRYSPMALQPWLANLGSSFSANNTTPRTLQDVAELVSRFFFQPSWHLSHID
jgi:glutamyl-tRNA synthetase